MKRPATILVILYVFSTSLNAQWTGSPFQLEVKRVISFVSDTAYASKVRGLEAFGTRHSSQPNRFDVANWIRDRFLNAGVSDVALDSFQYAGEWQVNVVATIPGLTDGTKEIIVGGHYDSQSWDVLKAPGADDNASGTAAVIEMAQALKSAGYVPNTTLRFVTFAAEEQGLLGSYEYASKARRANRQIVLMQNYDMIGHRLAHQNDRDVKVIWYEGAETEATLDSLTKCLYTTLTPVMSTEYRSQSDSWPFASMGYKAVFNIENDFSPVYHSPDDLSGILDFNYAAEIVKSGLALLLTVDDREMTAFRNITGLPDTLDFGNVNIGYPETLLVRIKNIDGPDPLVISSLRVSDPAFSVVPIKFTAEKGEVVLLRVVVNPTLPGNISAVLSIESNDSIAPDRSIILTAASQIASAITLAPDSLILTLYSGHLESHRLKIANTGGSGLSFEIEVELENLAVPGTAHSVEESLLAGAAMTGFPATAMQEPPLQAHRERALLPDETEGSLRGKRPTLEEQPPDSTMTIPPSQTMGMSSVAAAAPVGFFFEGFESSILTNWDFGYATAIREITSATFVHGSRSFHYANSWDYWSQGEHFNGVTRGFLREVRPSIISFYVRSGSVNASDAYFVLTDERGYSCIWFFARGNGRFYINKDMGGDNSYGYEELRWYKIEFRNIRWDEGLFDYFVNGKLYTKNIPMRNFHPNASLGDLHLYNYDVSEAWYDAIDVGGMSIWLTANPDSGIVSPGTEQNVDLLVSADHLTSGEYKATLKVRSNDPGRPLVDFPVKIGVTDAPSLRVDADAIDFGELFVGVADTLFFEVRNTGTQDLLIASAAVQPAEYFLTPAFAGVDPGESEIFMIIFHPQAVGSYPGTVTFTSNDPLAGSSVITLAGLGVEPPIAALDSDSIIVILGPGTQKNTTLAVQNSGGSTLRFTMLARSTSGMQAVQFDGIDGMIKGTTNGFPTGNSARTVELWFKRNEQSVEEGTLFAYGGWGIWDQLYYFMVQYDVLCFTQWGLAVWGGTVLQSHQWYHAAVVNIGSDIKLYLNGKLESTGNMRVNTLSNTSFYVGKAPKEFDDIRRFNGVMDEIRIWNVPRSEQEIRDTKDRELTGSEPGLIGYWRFDEGKDSVAHDISPNSNHGSLTGGVTWSSEPAPIKPGWIDFGKDTSVCPPQGTAIIDLVFDATLRDSGVFNASVTVQSNDPARPNISIPVRMIVSPVLAVEQTIELPVSFSLEQNYPNPFNPSTTIRYGLPFTSRVKLLIFNALGQQITELVNKEQTAGWKEIQWNGTVASGVYFYRLEAVGSDGQRFVETKKMVLLR